MRFGPEGGHSPSGRAIGGRQVSGAHGGAPLPGAFAQDQRNAVVRCSLSGPVGGARELFRSRMEVLRAGSVDRLEPTASIRSIEAGGQQQPFSDPPRLARPQSGISHPIALPKETLHLLTRQVRPSVGAARDFVDPQRFRGTVYRAANWLHIGESKGFRRTGKGYSAKIHSPKMVFLKPLHPDARQLLSSGPSIDPVYRTGGVKIMLNAEQMRSYPSFSPTSPIRAEPRADATVCPPCSALPLGRCFAGCAATRPYRTGPTALARRPGSVSDAVGKRAAILFQANSSSAMCLSVSIPCTWTVRCKAGTRSTGNRTRGWQ